ncbi:MAG: 2-oxo acid dehydrogenase subunit E2 [Bacteroidales bacterium]|nr:2-oxo acid dehydrogenase subunit E2 [Bacteroidales bacterium]
MAKFEITMPKMGESVIEATITKWLKEEGDQVEEDDSICELATDKVDSEIPSPVEGKLVKRLFEEGETVEVGKAIAVMEIEGEEEEEDQAEESEPETTTEQEQTDTESTDSKEKQEEEPKQESKKSQADFSESERFYSPLVKNIAREENISLEELESIKGSGKDNRVTKQDVLAYLDKRNEGKLSKSEPSKTAKASSETTKAQTGTPSSGVKVKQPEVTAGAGDEIVEMDRMRKLIADHMVSSKHISPHVTSYHEVDMTNIANWRNKHKKQFQEKENAKLTFTPIITEAAVKALKDFPGVNSSVDGHNIIYRKNINIGMATALPNGNLIVPVIKNADHKNLVGLTKDVNDLAERARQNKLQPDEIQGGTFTITNLGSFGNITGSPIINQPQVAILAIGAIKKRPVVIETENGDMVGIRHMMIISLAYDHRVVDGAMGGQYLAKLAEYLENFDTNRNI